tara:strand:- start:225 stop:395 length:171 start_codon:yes stop_codon:yes gene_type:complete
MFSEISRGTAINNKLLIDNNLKNINIKIAYIVNNQVCAWRKLIKIENNSYGKWIIK